MPESDRKQTIEALIFASDFPLSVTKICGIIDDLAEEGAAEIIRELQTEYERYDRGFTLRETAGGYEFVTQPEHAVWVRKLLAERRRMRLSRAGLETAAIIAYRQPVTRADVEKIRGVDSGGPLRTLLERKLIKIAGREKTPGRPIIYTTSEEFLRYFGVNSLADLPQLEEIQDIIHQDRPTASISREQLSLAGGDTGSEVMRPTD